MPISTENLDSDSDSPALARVQLKEAVETVNALVISSAEQAGTLSQLVETVDLLALVGFRNVLLNGNFDIAQRGEFFTTNGYCFDRWHASDLVNTTLYRVDISATYGTYALAAAPSSPTNGGAIAQPIENDRCRFLAGKKATLSFWASFGGAVGTLSASIWRNSVKNSMNTGTWNQLGAKSVNASGFQRYTLTVDIPADGSAEGIMPIISWSGLTNGQMLYLWGIQLEPGEVATKYDYRPVALELALCQRYYEILDCGVLVAGAAQVGATFSYKQEKRTTPTLTRIGAGAAGYTAPGATSVTTNSLLISRSGSDAGGVFTLSAEL